MLPLPNDDPPPPPREPQPFPELITPATPAELQPSPRSLPLVLWFLWLGLTSLVPVLFNSLGPGQLQHAILVGAFVGNLLLTPAWAALAIRPIALHVCSLLLVYFFILLIPEMLRSSKELFILFSIVFGTWSILRWGRVIALDLVMPDQCGGSSTPRLAERIQFSLRSLVLLSAVVALGISMYLFFQDSLGWRFYKLMFFIAVPSELLIFWGVLGRARWYLRIPVLLLAIHHWLLMGVMEPGARPWEKLYSWESLIRWLSYPMSQALGLTLLRFAGYRFGIPKPKERALPIATSVEPQSPWD